MGNCCCKSGAAGAVAAAHSDGTDGRGGTGRSSLGKIGDGTASGTQGGVGGGISSSDPSYGAVESTSSVKVAVVVSVVWQCSP